MTAASRSGVYLFFTFICLCETRLPAAPRYDTEPYA